MHATRSYRRACRPQLEALEDRTVPSSSGWAATTFTPADGSDPGQDIALDNAGNIYITGFFQGTTYLRQHLLEE